MHIYVENYIVIFIYQSVMTHEGGVRATWMVELKKKEDYIIFWIFSLLNLIVRSARL